MTRSQRTLLIVLVAALAVVVAMSVFGGDDDTASTVPTEASPAAIGEPEVVSPARLADLVAESGDPVYWIGPRRGARYELTETAEGRVFVRYLRGDAVAGDERADFVTVATYPASDGAAELRRAAASQGVELKRTTDGALLFLDPSSPESAHLAYPDTNVQIELFSPLPDHARRLAAGGEVRPVPKP